MNPMLHRAVAAHQEGRTAEALGFYQAILALDPVNSDALHLAGVALRGLGAPERAWRMILRAAAINLNLLGLDDNAVSIANDLLKKYAADPDRALLFDLDAHDFLTMLRPDDERLRQRQAALLSYLMTRAVAAYQAENLADANACCVRVRRSRPDHPDALFLHAQLRRRLGDVLGAIQDLLEAARLRPALSQRQLLTDWVQKALSDAQTAEGGQLAPQSVYEALFPAPADFDWPSEPPFLTIAIPTYNRAAALDRCLSAFVRQIDGLGRSDVRILLSDNGSTDETPLVIDRWRARRPYIFGHSNKTNLGFEWNAPKLLWLSADIHPSRYVWTFGDDDELVEGALAQAMQVLEAHRPDHLVIYRNLFEQAAADPSFRRIGEIPCALGAVDMFTACRRFGLFGVFGRLSSQIYRADLYRGLRVERHVNVFAHSTTALERLSDRDIVIMDAVFDVSERNWEEVRERWFNDNFLAGVPPVSSAAAPVIRRIVGDQGVEETFWGGMGADFILTCINLIGRLLPKDITISPTQRRAFEERMLDGMRRFVELTSTPSARRRWEEAITAVSVQLEAQTGPRGD